MRQPTLFTFWEPREKLIPYLKLCLRTWERHLPDFEIRRLDHGQLEGLIGDAYDLEVLKTLPLASQKDAIMVAVLNRHGGIFMDADTLVRGDISGILEHLKESETVFFGLHLAFLAARPGAKILSLWEEGIRSRLREAREAHPRREQWDFTGNSVLTDAMIEVTSDLPFARRFDRYWRSRPGFHSASKSFWQKVTNQRRWLIRLPAYRKYLRILPAARSGYIAETDHYGKLRHGAIERYLRFWFREDREVSDVFRRGQNLVALHNSWTPAWYRELSEAEVLGHECLLSRTLRQLLV